jgi:hypothetical protein
MAIDLRNSEYDIAGKGLRLLRENIRVESWTDISDGKSQFNDPY